MHLRLTREAAAAVRVCSKCGRLLKAPTLDAIAPLLLPPRLPPPDLEFPPAACMPGRHTKCSTPSSMPLDSVEALINCSASSAVDGKSLNR